MVCGKTVLLAGVAPTVSGCQCLIGSLGRRRGDARTYTAPVTDMTKAPVEAKPAEAIRPPRMINLVVAAVGAQVFFSIVRAVSMFGYSDQLRRWLVDSNNKAKKPTRPYGPAQITHDLHQLRVSGLIQGAVVAAALLLLAFLLRRQATATMSRWALLIVMVMTLGPFAVIPVHGLPVLPQVAAVLSGVACIAAIVLLFLPESRGYFKAISAARAEAAGRGAAPSRGLGSLFAPRPGAARKPPPPSGLRSTAASRANARLAKGSGTAAGARAKARADEAAIARGAALARSRAKASKSRRTER